MMLLGCSGWLIGCGWLSRSCYDVLGGCYEVARVFWVVVMRLLECG